MSPSRETVIVETAFEAYEDETSFVFSCYNFPLLLVKILSATLSKTTLGWLNILSNHSGNRTYDQPQCDRTCKFYYHSCLTAPSCSECWDYSKQGWLPKRIRPDLVIKCTKSSHPDQPGVVFTQSSTLISCTREYNNAIIIYILVLLFKILLVI